MHTHRSRTRTAAVVSVSAALAAAGGLAVAAPALAGADVSRTGGALVRYAPASTAERVPAGATGRVQAVVLPDVRTRVTLTVHGLLPRATYGAHAHVSACSVSQGGGHVQLRRAPSPEENTGEYANPVNEVWLDLTTDEAGDGRAQTEVSWPIRPGGALRSVIIHRDHTSTVFDAGLAGTAGPKLACLDAAS